VREATYGTIYIGGLMNISLLASIVQYFRQIGKVGIGCWINDPLDEILPIDPNYDRRTLYFTERSRRNDISYQLPSEYILAQRDRHLFSKSFDYESTLDSFGSLENVLKYTEGTIILQDEVLVCEAATGAPTHGRIEIGVTTAETYRGQGLARSLVRN